MNSEINQGLTPKSIGTAVIDWFSFTFDGYFSDANPVPMVRLWLQEWMTSPICGDEGNGLHGFQHSITFKTLRLGELHPVAVLAWGGQNQRGKVYVSINGSGCSLIKDWGCVRRIVESVGATITRADVAVDALHGEFNLEDASSWYENGGFNAGGRKPLYSVAGDWLIPTGEGRTFYVGRRKNGKYARIYEKGKQLGNRDSVWTRFEVELHNTGREIPYDLITEPSAYFAGCYPCCDGLVDVGAERIKTLRAEHEISLEQLKSYCRIAYGKLLHVLRFDVPRDELCLLVDELASEGVPRRLGKTSLSAFNSGGAASAEFLRSSDHGNAI